MRLLVTALALLMLAAPANAAEITVTTHADVVSKDFNCSLREAISSANRRARRCGARTARSGRSGAAAVAGRPDPHFEAEGGRRARGRRGR
jgi:CSLREA domain-containing protein